MTDVSRLLERADAKGPFGVSPANRNEGVRHFPEYYRLSSADQLAICEVASGARAEVLVTSAGFVHRIESRFEGGRRLEGYTVRSVDLASQTETAVPAGARRRASRRSMPIVVGVVAGGLGFLAGGLAGRSAARAADAGDGVVRPAADPAVLSGFAPAVVALLDDGEVPEELAFELEFRLCSDQGIFSDVAGGWLTSERIAHELSAWEDPPSRQELRRALETSLHYAIHSDEVRRAMVGALEAVLRSDASRPPR